MLKFVQNKMRNEKGTFEESCLTEIRHAAIDDDARIEHLRADRVSVELEEFLLWAGKLLLPEPRPEDKTQVGEAQQKHQSADMK